MPATQERPHEGWTFAMLAFALGKDPRLTCEFPGGCDECDGDFIKWREMRRALGIQHDAVGMA